MKCSSRIRCLSQPVGLHWKTVDKHAAMKRNHPPFVRERVKVAVYLWLEDDIVIVPKLFRRLANFLHLGDESMTGFPRSSIKRPTSSSSCPLDPPPPA